MALKSIDDIKRAVSAGPAPLWFSAETLRHWKTRVLSDVFPLADGGALFVTSEPDMHGANRRYTVRLCDASGVVDTVSDFREYATPGQARKAAREYVAP